MNQLMNRLRIRRGSHSRSGRSYTPRSRSRSSSGRRDGSDKSQVTGYYLQVESYELRRDRVFDRAGEMNVTSCIGEDVVTIYSQAQELYYLQYYTSRSVSLARHDASSALPWQRMRRDDSRRQHVDKDLHENTYKKLHKKVHKLGEMAREKQSLNPKLVPSRSEKCVLQATSYKLHVTSYKPQITSYKSQVTSYKLQVQGYKLQATSYKLQVKKLQSYKLQATS